jgi:hypothetical protein
MKQLRILQLKSITDRTGNYKSKIKAIESYFLDLMKPMNFDGNSSKNVLVVDRLIFEEMCVSLIEQGYAEPEQMSVLRFYTTIIHFEKKKPPK